MKKVNQNKIVTRTVGGKKVTGTTSILVGNK